MVHKISKSNVHLETIEIGGIKIVVVPISIDKFVEGGIVQSLYGRYPIITILKHGLPLSDAFSELQLTMDQAISIIRDENLQVPLSEYDRNDFPIFDINVYKIVNDLGTLDT